MPKTTIDSDVLLAMTQYIDLTNQVFGKTASLLQQLDTEASDVKSKAERNANMLKAAKLVEPDDVKIAVQQLSKPGMALDIMANVLTKMRDQQAKAAAETLGQAAEPDAGQAVVKRSCVVDERCPSGSTASEADIRAAKRYGMSL